MNFIGYGSVPKNKWRSSNSFKLNGMTAEEYANFRVEQKENPISKGEAFKEFWAARDEAVKNTAEVVNKIYQNNDPSVRRLHKATEFASTLKNSVDIANAEAIFQVQGASKQWRKLDSILSSDDGGKILGYDIESFGDTSGKNGIFGITEIGIGEVDVKNGGIVSEKGYAFAIGIDNTEATYLRDLVTKVRESDDGWNALEQHERVSLERASMYAGDSTSQNFRSVFSKKSVSNFGEFYTVEKLSESSRNLDTVERGIKFLSQLYEAGATRETVVPNTLKYLFTLYNNSPQNTVITGANTNFDTTAFRNYTKLYNIDTTFIDANGNKTLDMISTLKQNTVDVVYGTRTSAAIRTMSISEFQKIHHGKPGGGASIQSLLLSLGLNETETHLSLSDIFQQIRLLVASKFVDNEENGTLAHDIVSHLSGSMKNTIVMDGTNKSAIKNYNAKNSVFLLNRGWLDKTSGKDIAMVLVPDKDGNLHYEATQNYTISGEYWELDADGSGVYDDKYVLSLKSTADDTIIAKQFDNIEDLGRFLRNNAEWLEKDKVVTGDSTEYIEQQKKIKYTDTGRREFERAIDPNSVSTDGEGGKPTGGFASMEEYLNWHKKYGGKYNADTEGLRQYIQDIRIAEDAGEITDGFKIKDINTVQAGLGLQEKINREDTLLNAIVTRINQTLGDSDNMTKTIALRKAYRSALETMSTFNGTTLKTYDEQRNLISNDIFGIDVKLPDIKEENDNIKRINTSSVDFATKDISRIFTPLSKSEAVDVLENLYERNVLTKEQFKDFAKAIKTTGVDAGGDVKKARNIDKYFDNQSTYQLYTDIAYALHNATKIDTDGNILEEGRKKRLEPDAPKFTLESYSQKLIRNANIVFEKDGKQFNVNDFYGISEVQTAVDTQIANSIATTSTVTYYDKDRKNFSKRLVDLSNKLNYGNDITHTWTDDNGIEHSKTLLETLFYSDKKYGIGRQDNMHTYIIEPSEKGKSGYMIFTNDTYQAKALSTMGELTPEELSSFNAVKNSELANYAGIVELPYIDRYTIEENIDDALKKVLKRDTIDLTVIRQSENSEKFLVNTLNIYQNKSNGKVNAYMNNGVFDYLSSIRAGLGNAYSYIQDNDFSRFTSEIRRHQNERLTDSSGTSSYRGYLDANGKVVRRTNYSPADYMYAYQARMTNQLHELFNYALSAETGDKMNALDKLVDAFAEEFGEYHNPKIQGLKEFRQRISNQSYFTEFFQKNLFLGGVNDDFVIYDKYKEEFNGKTVFDLLKETIRKDSAGIFNSNVYEALQDIDEANKTIGINQNGSVTFGDKGYVTFGINPGDYNVNAFLYSTMRPTFAQQNLGRLIDPENEWNLSLNGEELKTSETIRVTGKDNVEFDMLNVKIGSPEVTYRDYIGKKALSSLYQERYDKRVRHIMTSYKQMNDYDLQMKYKYMYEKATTIASELGMSVEQYKQYLGYMREDMLSVNEGKWFMDPLVGEQRIIRSNDAKKVFGFHVEDLEKGGTLDKTKTIEKLKGLVNKEIRENDIIAVKKDGEYIYYDGPRGIFTEENMKDMLTEGKTKIIPIEADIVDTKVMFNGSEKATAHAISITKFMEWADKNNVIHGTRKETTLALSKIFNVLSDNAAFFGTQELSKHGNISGLDSIWRTITTNYVMAGQGEILVNHLNRLTETASEFKGIPVSSFSYDKELNVIISNASKVENPVTYITKLWEDVKGNQVDFGSETANKINSNIIKQIDWMREHSIIYGAMQIQNQNEHTSDGIAIDKRMEQGIRERILSVKDNGERWDLQWAEELNEYSGGYNAKSSYKGEDFRHVQTVFDYYNQKVNIAKIANQRKRKNMERGLYGIVESLMYYHAPEKFNIEEKNIVRIDLPGLMSSGVIPKNGAPVRSLHSSLFFEDGKPSEMLKELAKEQHKHFGSTEHPASYSLYVDLGDFAVRSADGKQYMNGFLIPIQTVITGADNTMFQTQQSIIASALSQIQSVIDKPGDRNAAKVTEDLNNIVARMYNKLFEQLAIQNKDSDYYKIMQKHFMPNSGGYLAGQEVSPLVTALTDDDEFNKAIEERNRLEKLIINNDNADKADIEALNKQYEIIDKKVKNVADEIRGVVRDKDTGKIIGKKDPKVMNFTALKGTKLEGLYKEFFDGTEKYSFIAATSKSAFEQQGLNFGKFGLDILQDYEQHGGKHIPVIQLDNNKQKVLYSDSQVVAVRKRIMDSINNDKSLGITITSDKTMIKEINDWLGKEYNIKKRKNGTLDIDIKTLNDDIAANGRMTKLLGHFESVGEHYMREIGMVGELIRYPTFRSQLAARWILSDNVEGKQVTLFNPITSSITNVDFDGDLMYSIFKLDGMVPFLKGDGEVTTYEISNKVYQRGLDMIPDLLAELVESGDAFKNNHLNNYVESMASMIEKFDKELYVKTIEEYAKNHGIEEITKGSAEEFAARSSKEMLSAFSNAKFNTLTNVVMKKASLASIFRKANIGRISTPNFTARDMIISMQSHYKHLSKQGVEGASETYDKITTILGNLTNMYSKKGGTFDHVEQVAIDTKHVWDALTTAQIARYSTGMNMLFGKNAKIDDKSRTQAVTHIVSALYNNVFADTQKVIADRKKGIDSIVKEIMAHKDDLNYFTSSNIEKLGIDVADRNIKLGIVSLLQMQDIDKANDLKNIKREYASVLNRGIAISSDGKINMDPLVGELFEAFKSGEFKSYHDNTLASGFDEFVQKAMSQVSLQYNDKLGYVKLGRINKDFSDYVYSLIDDGVRESGKKKGEAYATFEILRYNRATKTMEFHGTKTYTALNNYKLNQILSKEFDGTPLMQNTSNIKNFKDKSIEAIVEINKRKKAKLMSDTILTDKGKFASKRSINSRIKKMDSIDKRPINEKFGHNEFRHVRNLLGQTQEDTTRIISRISELGKLYEYAKGKKIAGATSITPNELIEQINLDITNNPEQHGVQRDANGKYVYTKMLDEILEDAFVEHKIFTDKTQIENIVKEMNTMSGFKVEEFNDIIDSLKESLYNVEKEVNILNDKYDEISQKYGAMPTVKDFLKERDTLTQKFREELSSYNKTYVEAYEESIYDLFKNRAQMDTFFGFDKPASADTLIGFGEYIGHKFSELSKPDAFNLLVSAGEYAKNGSEISKYAAEKTLMLYREWSSTTGVFNTTSVFNKSETSDILNEALKEVDIIEISAKMELDNITAGQTVNEAEEITEGAEKTAKEITKETVEQATGKNSKTRNKLKKRTISGEFKNFVDDLGITGKHVGIIAAGMAALGVVNNLLHGQKHGSPLSPERKPKGSSSPDINGNYPEHPDTGAPYSEGNKVVYHDKQSGLNFRVSARTSKNLDSRQQGINISTVTGGQTNVNIYQDNSGVIDNWLSNKFAELA